MSAPWTKQLTGSSEGPTWFRTHSTNKESSSSASPDACWGCYNYSRHCHILMTRCVTFSVVFWGKPTEGKLRAVVSLPVLHCFLALLHCCVCGNAWIAHLLSKHNDVKNFQRNSKQTAVHAIKQQQIAAEAQEQVFADGAMCMLQCILSKISMDDVNEGCGEFNAHTCFTSLGCLLHDFHLLPQNWTASANTALLSCFLSIKRGLRLHWLD